jgi:hypothetical protein
MRRKLAAGIASAGQSAAAKIRGIGNGSAPRPKECEMFSAPQAINHVAIAMPDHNSWLTKLEELAISRRA